MLVDLRAVERLIRRHCSCSVPDEHRLAIQERIGTLVLVCGTCGELCKAAATESAHDMAVRLASSGTLYGDVKRVFAAVGSRPPVSERTYFNTTGGQEYKAAIDAVYLEAVSQIREDAKQRIDSAAPDVRAAITLSVDARWSFKHDGVFCVGSAFLLGLPGHTKPTLVVLDVKYRASPGDTDATKHGAGGCPNAWSKALEAIVTKSIIEELKDASLRPASVLYDRDTAVAELYRAAFPGIKIVNCCYHWFKFFYNKTNPLDTGVHVIHVCVC